MKKSLKYTGIITAGLIFISIPFMVFHPFRLSAQFAKSNEVQLKFGQPVELSVVMDKIDDAGRFERIEKISDAEYKLEYLDFDSGKEEEIKNLASTIDGFTSMEVIEKRPVNPYFDTQSLVVYMVMALVMIFGFSYLLLDAREASHDKAGIALANTFMTLLLTLSTLLLVNLASISEVVNQQIFSFAAGLIVLSIVLNMINILRVNFYLKNNSEKNVSDAVVIFCEKYDESFVIFNLIYLLVILPVVVISRDRLILFVMATGAILVNIFAQTYSFIHFFLLWNKLIHTLPVIKDLKWVHK